MFENGTMDDHTAGTRLRALRDEIETLKARRDEITDAIEDTPTAPAPSTLERIRNHLGRILANGTLAERKAAIEQLIAEIRITEHDEIIPVFKIPDKPPPPPTPPNRPRFAQCFGRWSRGDSNP
ncbi:MAG TPA: hypothetical protein VNV66_15575 [Pilimelia sp.]|nr:hypothetical protein [Pilimelia sp.]